MELSGISVILITADNGVIVIILCFQMDLTRQRTCTLFLSEKVQRIISPDGDTIF